MCNIILITHVLMSSLFFFFNDTATTEIYTLSLHDALPISHPAGKIYPRTCVRRPGVVRMPSPLSAAQLTTIAQELAEGRPTTVWFTPAAVGVDAGKSAKVTALTDPAEGDFIQVKPTGSKDVLSFSPNELTLDKPPR